LLQRRFRLWAAKLGQVMRDVLLFPDRQRGLQHRIDGEMHLTRLSHARHCKCRRAQRDERTGVHPEFQWLAFPAFEDCQVHGHTAEKCNAHAQRLSAYARKG